MVYAGVSQWKSLLVEMVISITFILIISHTRLRQYEVYNIFVLLRSQERNIVEAASAGASTAVMLALNIGANLIAFLALLALFNGILGYLGNLVGIADLSFEVSSVGTYEYLHELGLRRSALLVFSWHFLLILTTEQHLPVTGLPWGAQSTSDVKGHIVYNEKWPAYSVLVHLANNFSKCGFEALFGCRAKNVCENIFMEKFTSNLQVSNDFVPQRE